jgi:histidinol-phosphate aminotransferase
MGHLRYSTTGKSGMSYVHPFLRRNNWRSRNLLLCGNFNMTNVDQIFNTVVSQGQHPRIYSDTFIILEQLLKTNPDRVVVIDEAYVDFGAESAVQLVNRYENLVVCQTTSKSRSLAGLRVGFAIAQAHLIAALEAVKNSFNSYPIDRFAIAAAVASFEDQAYFEAQCAKVIESREKLVGDLVALGFDVLPSKANFIFVTHPQYDAAQLAQQLREHGIIVRYFNKPRINQFLRITIGTDEQNQRLVNTLKNQIL